MARVIYRQVEKRVYLSSEGINHSRLTKFGCIYSILSPWYVGLPQENPYDSTLVLLPLSCFSSSLRQAASFPKAPHLIPFAIVPGSSSGAAIRDQALSTLDFLVSYLSAFREARSIARSELLICCLSSCTVRALELIIFISPLYSVSFHLDS